MRINENHFKCETRANNAGQNKRIAPYMNIVFYMLFILNYIDFFIPIAINDDNRLFPKVF
jgi:hypothetical protein